MIQGVNRETFELNPGLCELFKVKMRDKARRVGLSEDWLDFNSHLDMKGTYSENLAIFHREYPQLAEAPLQPEPPEPSEAQIGRTWGAYQTANGLAPETATALAAEGAVGPDDATKFDYPTLKFEFITETISAIQTPSEPAGPEQTPQRPKAAISRVERRAKAVVDGSTHFLIVGMKDEGKTCLASKLFEDHHNAGRPCFVFRPPKPELWPKWVKPIYDLAELPANAIVLIDEAPLQGFTRYNYRKPGTLQLRDTLEIARHNDQSFIFVSPNSPEFTTKLIYPVDVLLLKQPSQFQLLEERQLIRKAYQRIFPDKESFSENRIAKNEYYWADGETFERSTFSKPEWFTEELSKSYRNFRPGDASTELLNHPSAQAQEAGDHVYDASMLTLVGIVGGVGLLGLLHAAWSLAGVCLPLALLGLYYAREPHWTMPRSRKAGL